MERIFMTKKEKEALAPSSTMTAFEWRVKLLKEHSLYLYRRPYGSGDFVVQEVTGKWNDSYVKTQGSKQIISYDEMFKAGCKFRTLVNYNAFKCYTDETIKEVVLKAERSDKREVIKEQNANLRALNMLAG